MRTLTPETLPKLTEPCSDKHEWAYYNGCLGYESNVCLNCGIDINDIEDLRMDKEEAEARADLTRKYGV